VYVAPLVPPTTANPRTLNLGNINFIHNTFYNCGDIDLGGTGATNNTWANNIFQKNSGTIYTNPNSGTTWAGNIYQGTIGITIPSGMTSTNPFLALNSDGFRGLSVNSPVNNSSAGYPTILDIPILDDDPNLLFDISGQARPSTVTLKDVGCDEFTTGTLTNHPLTLSEVGPSYLMLSSTDFEINEKISILFPNPTKNNFRIMISFSFDKRVLINIFDATGKTIQTIVTRTNQILYVGDNWKSEIYFAEVTMDKKRKRIKMEKFN
jgi:hypothetical protein